MHPTRTFQVRSLADLLPGGLTISDMVESIAADHRGFLGHQPFPKQYHRSEGKYDLSASVEKVIADQWTDFEAQYHAAPYHSLFWSCTLEGAVVHPPHGVVSVGNFIVSETIRDSKILSGTFPEIDRETALRAMNDPDVAFEINTVETVTYIAEPCFHLGWGLNGNYFNWTLFYLANLTYYQRGAGDQLLLVPGGKVAYINDTLEFFGVRQSDVRYLNGPTRIARLTLTGPTALSRYQVAPSLVPHLRDHRDTQRLWRDEPQGLYIPRQQVKMRRVTNDDAVQEHLKARGFTIFDSARYKIAEQIRMFKAARLIVAPHGAGLANVVYSAPGTSVIEFVPEGYDQGVTSYRSLSDLFSLDYLHVAAREVALDRKNNRCNSDIEIPIPQLDQLLDQVGWRRQARKQKR